VLEGIENSSWHIYSTVATASRIAAGAFIQPFELAEITKVQQKTLQATKFGAQATPRVLTDKRGPFKVSVQIIENPTYSEANISGSKMDQRAHYRYAKDAVVERMQ